jgi:hypothetical protein
MSDKCIVREGRIIEPCADLDRQCEVGNPPPGKSRGIYEWRYHNTETHKVSRAFFGVKTTETPKGFLFNFCPFCGERICAPFKEAEAGEGARREQ